jgi:hypothetical protein
MIPIKINGKKIIKLPWYVGYKIIFYFNNQDGYVIWFFVMLLNNTHLSRFFTMKVGKFYFLKK